MSDSLYFKATLEEERRKAFAPMSLKSKRRNLKYREHQMGTTNKLIDSKRDALLSGKRMSKNGKTYYEYRRNRSDLKDTNI